MRPETLTIRLLANGEEVAQQVISGESNVWDYQFDNLSVYQNGEEIAYTVIEDLPEGYSQSSVAGDFNLVNERTPDQTSVTITKIWDGMANQDGIRPETVEVQLYADGDVVGDVVTLVGPEWTHTWSGLPVNQNGQAITYTVEETNVAEGYEATTPNIVVDGNVTITNSHTPETIMIEGTKTWDDNQNASGQRPQSIVVHLLANDIVVDSQEISGEDDIWNFSFGPVPTYQAGEVINYTISEEAVEGYTLQTPIEGYHLVNKLDAVDSSESSEESEESSSDDETPSSDENKESSSDDETPSSDKSEESSSDDETPSSDESEETSSEDETPSSDESEESSSDEETPISDESDEPSSGDETSSSDQSGAVDKNEDLPSTCESSSSNLWILILSLTGSLLVLSSKFVKREE